MTHCHLWTLNDMISSGKHRDVKYSNAITLVHGRLYICDIYISSIDSNIDYLENNPGSLCYVDSIPSDRCLHSGLTSWQNIRVIDILRSDCPTEISWSHQHISYISCANPGILKSVISRSLNISLFQGESNIFQIKYFLKKLSHIYIIPFTDIFYIP